MNQYEQNELVRFHREITEIEKAPLNERKEGKQDLLDDILSGIDHFITQAGWIINGSYGAGAQLAFKQMSKRTNRRAWLFTTYAQMNHRTSYKYAVEVWKALPPLIQREINQELNDLIAEHDSDV